MVTLLHGRLLQWSTYAICCFSVVVTQNVFIWWTAGESNPVLLRARQVCSQVYQQPIIDNLSYYTPSIKAIIFGLGRRNRTFATWPQTTHDTISPHREILAPEAGIEPTTNWLTVNCTTAVLLWNIEFVSLRRIYRRFIQDLPAGIAWPRQDYLSNDGYHLGFVQYSPHYGPPQLPEGGSWTH